MTEWVDDLTTPAAATDVCLDAAWVARDLCIVLAAALEPHGEPYGPPLLDALRTVAGLAEEQADRALKAAGAASDLMRKRR